ncbi:MAG TPA: magnesium-translocating P-type ATPase [Acidimicrobiales bacterium]|nr:magnesium-translocating P-type ATPase [Acidimicrobiales bacterium]
MARTVDGGSGTAADLALSIDAAAHHSADEVLELLGTGPAGLTSAEASARLETYGPNAVRSHEARALAVLLRQLRSPLLFLLAVTATISFFVGERTDALIIGTIVTLSVGLGFANEYRAERTSEELHSQLRHRAVVRRDGKWTSIDVTELVRGDLVRLQLGEVVPADLRLLRVADMECDEAVLTGESVPVEKDVAPVTGERALAELSSCALMGTIVRSGSCEAVVVGTGGDTEFGRIALGLGERQEETAFQVGLRRFSLLLARVALVLTVGIFVINVALQRPVIDALLFSLAIAVGITPQLLPAVVTTSLATGSRRLAQRRVLVKRLVCIEDLGDIDVLLTDKTGTLTDGHISLQSSIDPAGQAADRPRRLGLLCNEAAIEGGAAVGGNPLDVALWEGATPADREQVGASRRVAILPFDHERRRVSVVVDGPEGRVLITKGAPEDLLTRCDGVPDGAAEVMERELRSGGRVVAIATRDAPGMEAIRVDDECDLHLEGFLVFLDRPKLSATAALGRLDRLGIRTVVLTGDNPLVAEHVCDEIGLRDGRTLVGEEVDRLDEDALQAALPDVRVFARMSPEQKTRVIRAQRALGSDVAFLGDGVNDAVALHAADVGVSVDTATDVAKDAADIILLDKDLDVLADGVVEGRRTFANTIKYVMMGTSSNFGNMFSAAVASAFLSFLPMLPSQILLNNLLYDTSQLSIPTDRVDEEQLARPAHWDLGLIKRFMLVFGPISSLFDFATFAIMLNVFHAGPSLFRSGWFVESLATQTLVIFVIRTRRVPFTRSRPGRLLTAAVLSVVAIGAILPYSPMAATLGFQALPAAFFGVLVAMVAVYLALVEVVKQWFYRWPGPGARIGHRPRRARRINRRAARFSRPIGPTGGASSPGASSPAGLER